MSHFHPITNFLKYGFVPSFCNKDATICLLCKKELPKQAVHYITMKNHLIREHPDKGKKNMKYFINLYNAYKNENNLFPFGTRKEDDDFIASHNISFLLAKSGNFHNLGENLVLPAVKEVLSTVMHESAYKTVGRLNLTFQTVQRQIDDISKDIENTLCNFLQTTYFSVHLDEIPLPDNRVLLLVYVSFILEKETYEEFFFDKVLWVDDTGTSMFEVLKDHCSVKSIPLRNIASVSLDRAPTVTERLRGFVTLLKLYVPGLIVIHPIIHRQHVAAAEFGTRLHETFQYVNDAVDQIVKNMMTTQLFSQLFQDNGENFELFLINSDVQWLSKGLDLKKFYSLFDEILLFLNVKNPTLKENLLPRRPDVAYLVDLFTQLDNFNSKMESEIHNIVRAKSIISGFIAIIKNMKEDIERRDFSLFRNLKYLDFDEDDADIYIRHLNTFHFDLQMRYDDIENLEVPDWIVNPYCDISEERNLRLRLELLQLSQDVELKVEFKRGFHYFWLYHNIPYNYPISWHMARKFLLSIPSTKTIDKGHITATRLLLKKRLNDSINDSYLRLLLTNLKPNFRNIYLNNHPESQNNR